MVLLTGPSDALAGPISSFSGSTVVNLSNNGVNITTFYGPVSAQPVQPQPSVTGGGSVTGTVDPVTLNTTNNEIYFGLTVGSAAAPPPNSSAMVTLISSDSSTVGLVNGQNSAQSFTETMSVTPNFLTNASGFPPGYAYATLNFTATLSIASGGQSAKLTPITLTTPNTSSMTTPVFVNLAVTIPALDAIELTFAGKLTGTAYAAIPEPTSLVMACTACTGVAAGLTWKNWRKARSKRT